MISKNHYGLFGNPKILPVCVLYALGVVTVLRIKIERLLTLVTIVYFKAKEKLLYDIII